jgi:hypothetical protein
MRYEVRGSKNEESGFLPPISRIVELKQSLSPPGIQWRSKYLRWIKKRDILTIIHTAYPIGGGNDGSNFH